MVPYSLTEHKMALFRVWLCSEDRFTTVEDIEAESACDACYNAEILHPELEAVHAMHIDYTDSLTFSI